MRKEGFEPIPITSAPGFVYPPPQASETKLLVFLKGTLFCTFLWSEKNLEATV
ncbi:MAG: hypothetical protein HY428_01640 [Candidatus Levybacteria bacterium]|nr:hypothetical protein [Candidatus Levybacteria bacterium]